MPDSVLSFENQSHLKLVYGVTPENSTLVLILNHTKIDIMLYIWH